MENKKLLQEKDLLLKQQAKIQESLEESRQKILIYDKQISTIECDGKVQKECPAMLQSMRKKFQSVCTLLKINMILYLVTLFVYVCNSQILISKLRSEFIFYKDELQRDLVNVNSLLSDNKLVRILIWVMCLIVVSGVGVILHRLIALRTTMWIFYYIEHGVEKRSMDRLRVLSTIEYIAGLTLWLAEKNIFNHSILTWIILSCISVILMYFYKVFCSYRRRIFTSK